MVMHATQRPQLNQWWHASVLDRSQRSVSDRAFAGESVQHTLWMCAAGRPKGLRQCTGDEGSAAPNSSSSSSEISRRVWMGYTMPMPIQDVKNVPACHKHNVPRECETADACAFDRWPGPGALGRTL